jgi:hypothetical protein
MAITRSSLRFAVLGFACLCSGPLCAQEPVTLDPASVIALAEAPWRDRAAFAAALDAALGGVEMDMPRLPETLRRDDPFLWSITGRFGTPLPGVRSAGGIVVCSRYGLETRARLAETRLSDPEAFALFGATHPAADDVEVWPETGIARLACMITWNDSRRVAFLPEAAAEAALATRFARISRRAQPDVPRADPGAIGMADYRLVAQDGPVDTVVQVESARIELRQTHQQIRFRAFLLNGGM